MGQALKGHRNCCLFLFYLCFCFLKVGLQLNNWVTKLQLHRAKNGTANTKATMKGGALSMAPLVQSPVARGRRGADGGKTMMAMEISQWCKQIKKEKETKMQVIGPLMPPAKSPQVRSYHKIVTQGGSGIDRVIAASPQLVIKKKKKKQYATEQSDQIKG